MQVSHLSVLLTKEDSDKFKKINLKSKPLSPKLSDQVAETLSSDDEDVQILESATLVMDKGNVIVLSDDEMDKEIFSNVVIGGS